MRFALSHRMALLCTFVPVATSALPGCVWGIGAQQIDYASGVAAVCDYRYLGGTPVKSTDAETIQSTLTPQCKAALEEILPFDDSFNNAPPGFKDHVTETFQTLLAYPLALPPQNRLFGVRDNGILLSHLCVLAGPLNATLCGQEPPAPGARVNLGHEVFNYVVNKIDRISYVPERDGLWAYNSFDGTSRVITFFGNFWIANVGADAFRTPFVRAAITLHEARHGDGIYHDRCPEPDGTWECDTDANGPYGLEVSYQTMLLHGSVGVVENGKPILSDQDIATIGYDLCRTYETQVLRHDPVIADLIQSEGCNLNTAEVLAREGLVPAVDSVGITPDMLAISLGLNPQDVAKSFKNKCRVEHPAGI